MAKWLAFLHDTYGWPMWMTGFAVTYAIGKYVYYASTGQVFW